MKKFFGLLIILGISCLCFGFKTVPATSRTVAAADMSMSEAPKADELSGGACGYDDQCATVVAYPCNNIINGHHYTTRIHPNGVYHAHNLHTYKVPCPLQACGVTIPPPIGFVLPPLRTTPASYDIEDDCSDGSKCYHLACDESVGATTIYQGDF